MRTTRGLAPEEKSLALDPLACVVAMWRRAKRMPARFCAPVTANRMLSYPHNRISYPLLGIWLARYVVIGMLVETLISFFA